MKLLEDNKNILEINSYVKSPYVLASFVSADLIISDPQVKSLIRENFSGVDFVKNFEPGQILTTSITTGKFEVPLYSLIVKRFIFNDVDYEIIAKSLENLKNILVEQKYSRLAIYNSSKDGIDWGKVKVLINKVFKNIDITIKICIN